MKQKTSRREEEISTDHALMNQPVYKKNNRRLVITYLNLIFKKNLNLFKKKTTCVF